MAKIARQTKASLLEDSQIGEFLEDAMKQNPAHAVVVLVDDETRRVDIAKTAALHARLQTVGYDQISALNGKFKGQTVMGLNDLAKANVYANPLNPAQADMQGSLDEYDVEDVIVLRFAMGANIISIRDEDNLETRLAELGEGEANWIGKAKGRIEAAKNTLEGQDFNLFLTVKRSVYFKAGRSFNSAPTGVSQSGAELSNVVSGWENNQNAIRLVLIACFSQSEMKLLVRDLSVDPEIISGFSSTKDTFAAEIVSYFDRRIRLKDLTAAIWKINPSLPRPVNANIGTRVQNSISIGGSVIGGNVISAGGDVIIGSKAVFVGGDNHGAINTGNTYGSDRPIRSTTQGRVIEIRGTHVGGLDAQGKDVIVAQGGVVTGGIRNAAEVTVMFGATVTGGIRARAVANNGGTVTGGISYI